MKKVLRVILLIAIVGLLGLLSAGVALAQSPAKSEIKVKGQVTAISKTTSPATVTITPKEGAPVTVKVTSSTVITKSGSGKSKATLDDVEVGDRADATYDKDTLEASRLAISAPIGKHHSFVGTLKSVATDSFVVTTKKDTEITVKVNTHTKYKVPGVRDAALVNFKAGYKVAVLAVEVKGVGNVALHVVLIPSKPLVTQRTGAVETYQPNQRITLKDNKGETITFVVTQDTKIKFKGDATAIEPGMRVIVIARREPGNDQFTAKEIVVLGQKK